MNDLSIERSLSPSLPGFTTESVVIIIIACGGGAHFDGRYHCSAH